MNAVGTNTAHSTSAIASSTTMPIASTSPNSESVFNVNPSANMIANVPTSDTGSASSGIIEARQVCKKISTTSTTRISASTNVWPTASIDCLTNTVGS